MSFDPATTTPFDFGGTLLTTFSRCDIPGLRELLDSVKDHPHLLSEFRTDLAALKIYDWLMERRVFDLTRILKVLEDSPQLLADVDPRTINVYLQDMLDRKQGDSFVSVFEALSRHPHLLSEFPSAKLAAALQGFLDSKRFSRFTTVLNACLNLPQFAEIITPTLIANALEVMAKDQNGEALTSFAFTLDILKDRADLLSEVTPDMVAVALHPLLNRQPFAASAQIFRALEHRSHLLSEVDPHKVRDGLESMLFIGPSYGFPENLEALGKHPDLFENVRRATLEKGLTFIPPGDLPEEANGNSPYLLARVIVGDGRVNLSLAHYKKDDVKGPRKQLAATQLLGEWAAAQDETTQVRHQHYIPAAIGLLVDLADASAEGTKRRAMLADTIREASAIVTQHSIALPEPLQRRVLLYTMDAAAG